jgi:hypothetical protein
MTNLSEFKNSILGDGVIDEQKVNSMRSVLYADGIIDQEEADFLFELNDAVSGKANHSSWKTFFIEAICDFLLKDEVSPGEIDAKESAWLIEKIQGDGKVDSVEKELLVALKASAKGFPSELEELIN